MAKLKDTEINGNLVVNGNVAGNLEVDGTVLTDNIRVTDDTNRGELSSTVPMAGCYDEEGGLDLFTTLQDRKSFIGSLNHPEGWFNVLSIRHRNGWGDGNKYGMMMWAPMTQDGNLSWSQQRSSGWKTAKTILDSANVGSYAIPKNINTGLNVNANGTGTYTLPAMDTRNKDYLMIVRSVNPAYFKFCILSPNSDRTTYWCHTIYSAGAIDVSVAGNVLSIINNSTYQMEFRINLVPLL